MKLAVVCFPGLGGSGVVAAELAVGLADRGHEVHLIASAPPSRAAGHERVRFHQVTVPTYPVFEHAPYDLAVATAIASIPGLDLVNVHYAVPHAASAYLARQMLGRLRVVTSIHGTDVMLVGADPAYRAITRFTVLASDAIVAPSAYLRRAAHEKLGLPEERVEVIPNFVDTDRFAPGAPRRGDGGPLLFHVSNLRPVKRPVDLAELVARLRRDVPARMVIVGDGPERAALERRARELGVTAHLELLGQQCDFVPRLQEADAFVMTSASESFGVAALEAMSAGVPVFGYQVGGLGELVTDEVGALVPSGDVEALARAILAALPRREALGRAARARALAMYRREPALARYEGTFLKLLEST